MKASRLWCVGVIFLLLISSAHANLLTVQTNVVGHHEGARNETLTFDQYDGELPLESIRITFTTWMHKGALEWTNNSVETATIEDANLGIRTSLTSGDVTLDDGSGDNPWYRRPNYITLDEFELGAFQYAVLPGPESNLAQRVETTAYIASAYWDDFIGSGTFDLLYNSEPRFGSQITGGNVTQTHTPAWGNAVVVITYTAIPEPSTLALFGLTGLTAFWWRRRRNVKT